MSSPWFTNPDASGELVVAWHGDGWYVESSATDSEVKCLLQGDGEPDPEESPVRLAGTVSKYTYGTGDATDFLFLQADEAAPKDTPESTAEDGGSPPEASTASVASTTESPDRTASDRASSASNATPDESLGQIAADQIGDTELTETREGRESSVGRAKRRASDQQRDPAIDPRLQGDDDSDD